MIDLHTHVLPGVDDGAQTIDETLEIARAAVADGVEALAATPHVREDYPTEPETMERLVDEVREVLAGEGVPLAVHTGGEIALDRVELLGEDVRRFALAGSRYVLLEFPYAGWPLGLDERVFALAVRGLVAVLAHPERSAEVQAAPERLAPAVGSGALVQVTAASLDGRLGRASQRAGHALVRAGLAHVIASDAHAPALRGVGMSAAAESVGDERLASWLTRDVPAAVLADEAPPPRPPSARRRPWWARALGRR